MLNGGVEYHGLPLHRPCAEHHLHFGRVFDGLQAADVGYAEVFGCEFHFLACILADHFFHTILVLPVGNKVFDDGSVLHIEGNLLVVDEAVIVPRAREAYPAHVNGVYIGRMVNAYRLQLGNLYGVTVRIVIKQGDSKIVRVAFEIAVNEQPV